MILEVSELRDDRRRQQVRTGRQDLAELGEGRPEFLQRAAEPPGPFGLIVLAPGHDVPQPVPGEDPGHVRRAAEELALRWLGGGPGGLPRRGAGAVQRGIDDHDRAPGVVRNLVGNAAEQELGAVPHADVADHDQVDPLLLADPHDGLRRVGVVDEQRPAALAADLPGECGQVVRGTFPGRQVLGGNHLQHEQFGSVFTGQLRGPLHGPGRGIGLIGSDQHPLNHGRPPVTSSLSTRPTGAVLPTASRTRRWSRARPRRLAVNAFVLMSPCPETSD